MALPSFPPFPETMFAKDLDVSLNINTLHDCPLQSLNAKAISSSTHEILIICAQLRFQYINHTNPDDRREFLKLMRSMEPQGVILTDENMDCSCSNFNVGFSQSLDCLWSFLDSTCMAFKGRDMEERKLIEGEAAKALTNTREMNDGKERMRDVGFAKNVDDFSVIGIYFS